VPDEGWPDQAERTLTNSAPEAASQAVRDALKIDYTIQHFTFEISATDLALLMLYIIWVMYGRRPRCKGKESDLSRNDTGAVMYPASKSAAVLAAGPDVIR
jgi:hypothetical protein